MAGIRIGGVGVVTICSPPWTAFGGAGTSGDPQVYVACSSDPAGEATQYTDFSGFADADQCFNPVLSPDGTMVLFEVLSPTTGFHEIWVVDAIAGSTPTQLVADASNYVKHPAWAPDSDTFTYVHGTGGTTSAMSVYKDTVSSPGSPTLLKADGGGSIGAYRPQFNFDGTRIAYIYTATGDPQLRCMDDDGSNDGIVDNALVAAYDSNEPPQFGWANTQNLLCFNDGAAAAAIYVIDDTGGGKTQVNANGAAAGAAAYIAGYGYAFPANDAYVVMTANLGAGFYNVIRAELDGSNTTVLGSDGPVTTTPFRPALVYQNRIFYITDINALGGDAEISYMPLAGSAGTVLFDSSLGSGDQVAGFTGGDGWYFN